MPLTTSWKRAAPLVEMAIEDDGAEAGFDGARFGPLARRRRLRGELVERLIAVSGREPEAGVLDFDAEIDDIVAGVKIGQRGDEWRLDRDWRSGLVILDGDARGAGGGGFDLDLRVDVGDFPADVALADGEVGDADLVPGLKADGTPDAAGDEVRAPVPSVLIGGFADVGLGGGPGFWLPWIEWPRPVPQL